MMPRIFVLVVLLLAAADFGIAQENPRPVSILSTFNLSSDESALLTQAVELLDKGERESGTFLLGAIIVGNSESDEMRAACLALADSYNDAGGSQSLALADFLYSQLLSSKPDDKNADSILYRLAQTQLRRKITGEGSTTILAEKSLKTLLERFPKSTLRPQAEELLHKVQETLGDSDLAVAKFYFTNRGAMAGAEDRLKEIIEKYTHYSKMDEVLLLLGKTELAREEYEESAKYLRLLIEKYPNSCNAPAARELLGNRGEILPQSCK